MFPAVKKINWETQTSISNVCSVHKLFLFNFIFFFLEPPLVRVNCKKLFQWLELFCTAHGFYPPEISMIWMKNGEEMIQKQIMETFFAVGMGPIRHGYLWSQILRAATFPPVTWNTVMSKWSCRPLRVRTGCGCLGRETKGGWATSMDHGLL